MTGRAAAEGPIAIGALEERDLPAADRVFRLAFGTALGLPDPLRFAAGADLVRSRWLADPTAAFKAEADGELVGSAFASCWGSFATFGPLTVHPDFWDRGVGRRLWEARMPLLERWGTTHAAVFTRPEPRNVHLYQQFGFWPRSLTALTAKDVAVAAAESAASTRFSALGEGARGRALDGCRALLDAIFPGLDLEREIRLLDDLEIGETLLLGDAGDPEGLAVCHTGEGSEAGAGACYVKFAAVRPGAGAAAGLGRLLDACEELAAERGLARLVAGVSVARREAYGALLSRRHRTFAFGVAMHRPDEDAYDRRGVHVLDDRR